MLIWTITPDPPIPQGGSFLAAVILAIIGFFFGGGLIAYLRLRKEGPKIIVEAAQGAVVVQSGVIATLEKQISDLTGQLVEARKMESKIRQLEHNEELLRVENERLKNALIALRERVAELETKGTTTI